MRKICSVSDWNISCEPDALVLHLDSGMGTVGAGCEGAQHVRSRSLTEQRLGQWVVQGVWSEVGAKVVRG